MQGGKFEKQTDETGKVVIVTGSNTGIGKETVLELARRGATVYMACRDKSRAEKARLEVIRETKNQNIFFRELDLASLDSVRKFVDGFKKEQSKLDILINNAGIMHCPRMLTKEGFEMQLGVNHMGHFLLTNLLLDLLKKSSPSRIVNVSSLVHAYGTINFDDLNSEKSYNPDTAYIHSKLANILFTRELAKRLEGTNVTVNALHPGVIETELGRHVKIFNNPIFLFLVSPLVWLIFKTPKNGAQTTLYAALDPDLNGVTGLYFSDCKPKEVSAAAKDANSAKRLWEESEKWTKAK
ncbi:retinol dehydrogenase 14-like isoform X2 [Drosophila sulfurigaster albostrigata]|nr:retinol dehydrogenase 14-like isoform X2 [Drosophila sulfurigaster albostrigata]